MKIILCVVLCVVWWSSPIHSIKKRYVGIGEPNMPNNRRVIDVEDKWFLQKLDHFNPTNNRTWEQVDKSYYVKLKIIKQIK